MPTSETEGLGSIRVYFSTSFYCQQSQSHVKSFKICGQRDRDHCDNADDAVPQVAIVSAVVVAVAVSYQEVVVIVAIAFVVVVVLLLLTVLL